MPSADAIKQPPSKPVVLLRRTVSSLLLWAVVIIVIFSGNKSVSDYVFLLLMLVLAGAGLTEFYGLVTRRGLVCFKGWGIFGGLLLMVSTFVYLSQDVPAAKANDFETTFLILFVLGLCFRQFLSRSNPAGLLAISTTLFGLMYVPWLLNFIQNILFFPHVNGRFFVL